jgi:hypothetical protein
MVMRELKLKVKQRIAYKVTTKPKHSGEMVGNLLNQNFNPIVRGNDASMHNVVPNFQRTV